VLINPRYDPPGILSLDGRADAIRAPLVRQRRRLAEIGAGLSADDWTAPSRCEGWRVQDVFAHLVGVDGFWLLSLSTGLAGEPTRILGGFDPHATPAAMVDATRGQSPTETLDQFVGASEQLLEFVEQLDPDEFECWAEAPPGHLTLSAVAHHALWDAWIHERDILEPLGRVQDAHADEIEACLRYCAAMGPALQLQAGPSRPGAYSIVATDPPITCSVVVGDSVCVTAAATPNTPTLAGRACELIDALTMRADLPADAPKEWHDLRSGLARAFDQ
jgi:uncharacterized protein (TIGR03083 family)